MRFQVNRNKHPRGVSSNLGSSALVLLHVGKIPTPTGKSSIKPGHNTTNQNFQV